MTTIVALRAGMQPASSVTPVSSSEMTVNVAGSIGLTLKSKLDMTQVKAKAVAKLY